MNETLNENKQKPLGARVVKIMLEVSQRWSKDNLRLPILTHMGIGINWQLSQPIDFAKGILMKCKYDPPVII